MTLSTDECYLPFAKNQKCDIWIFYNSVLEAYTACEMKNDEMERYLNVFDPEKTNKRPFEVITLKEAIKLYKAYGN
jgi:hypothetical protein